MSEAEIRELLLMHVDQVDSAFEFWLTASFAVLIAHTYDQTDVGS